MISSYTFSRYGNGLPFSPTRPFEFLSLSKTITSAFTFDFHSILGNEKSAQDERLGLLNFFNLDEEGSVKVQMFSTDKHLDVSQSGKSLKYPPQIVMTMSDDDDEIIEDDPRVSYELQTKQGGYRPVSSKFQVNDFTGVMQVLFSEKRLRTSVVDDAVDQFMTRIESALLHNLGHRRVSPASVSELVCDYQVVDDLAALDRALDRMDHGPFSKIDLTLHDGGELLTKTPSPISEIYEHILQEFRKHTTPPARRILYENLARKAAMLLSMSHRVQLALPKDTAAQSLLNLNWGTEHPTPDGILNLQQQWTIGSDPDTELWLPVGQTFQKAQNGSGLPHVIAASQMVPEIASQTVPSFASSSQTAIGITMTQPERGVSGSRERKKKKARTTGF